MQNKTMFCFFFLSNTKKMVCVWGGGVGWGVGTKLD